MPWQERAFAFKQQQPLQQKGISKRVCEKKRKRKRERETRAVMMALGRGEREGRKMKDARVQ